MGMTHDFEVAIEEGATMVRVGTAIFGRAIKQMIIGRIFWFLESAAIGDHGRDYCLDDHSTDCRRGGSQSIWFDYRTVRRLSDGFVAPVRGLLREFHADPKFAPIVVIVVAILMGLLVINLLGTLSQMTQGIIWALRVSSLPALLGFVFHGLISIYILMIFVRFIFTMAMVSYMNRVMRFLVDTTEPLLGPLRRRIPPWEDGTSLQSWRSSFSG